MPKIKVIKKKELSEQCVSRKTDEEELTPKSAERGAVETIENWVADWRKQTKIKTRMAFGELAQLRLKNSIGI